jgi:hypothetical protein
MVECPIYPEAANGPTGYHTRDLSALRPGVSVFVASLNTVDALELAVRSATRLSDHSFDLIIGDSGSTDGSLELIRRLEAEGIVSDHEVVPGRPHWEWLDHWRQSCPTRYAVFVDSDVQFLAPGWLEALLEWADREKWAMVGGEFIGEQPDSLHAGVILFRFAARLAPWLLLVDIERCDRVHVSFQDGSHPSTQVHEGTIAYDVGGRLFHSLRLLGIGCGAMPAAFRQSYRHQGGLSWLGPGSGRQRLKRSFQRMAVKGRLRLERRR